MQFPFHIEFEPPTHADLCRAVRTWWVWAILIGVVSLGVAALILSQRHSQEVRETESAALEITSTPSNALIELDGRARGRTPAVLPVTPATHRITVSVDGYGTAIYQIDATAVQTTTLHAALWIQTPHVLRLRPTFPGAVITNADFLSDGQVALTLALASGDERQLWLVNGQGGLRRLGPTDVYGSLTVSSDGHHVAYLASGQPSSFGQGRLDEVWLARADGERGQRVYGLPADATSERLVDVAWSPNGQGLLLASRQVLSGNGFRTRLQWLDVAGGETRELVVLPSEVVPGSYSWSPTEPWLAFLTRAGQVTSLCLLHLDSGAFRYLADVNWDDKDGFSFLPLAWEANGNRLVYAAPSQDRPQPSGWLFGAKPAPTLFITDLIKPLTGQLGNAEGHFPAWHRDARLFSLARAKSNGPLLLRAVEPTGAMHDLGELPIKIGSSYAVRWDVAHAQAIVVSRASGTWGGGQTDYWLVQWRPGEGQ